MTQVHGLIREPKETGGLFREPKQEPKETGTDPALERSLQGMHEASTRRQATYCARPGPFIRQDRKQSGTEDPSLTSR